jgi:hypothetical protein
MANVMAAGHIILKAAPNTSANGKKIYEMDAVHIIGQMAINM